MSIQFTRVLDSQAIGSVVYTLGGPSSFNLISNPGNLFALNGNQISINAVLSIGITSIIVEDSKGNQSTLTFDVISVAPFWVPGNRPFTATSPINIPLPSGIPLQRLPWDPASTGGTGFYTFSTTRFTFDVPDPSAVPQVTISGVVPGAWGNPGLVPPVLPMTVGFTGSGLYGDFDQIGVIIVNGLATQLQDFFQRNSDTTASASVYGQADVLANDGFGYPNYDGPNGCHAAGPVATGSSVLCGAFLKQECDAFTDIKHALSAIIHADYCAPGFYPPAINGDGNRTNGMICEGQFLAVPKTVSPPVGLSNPYGLKAFRALQNYGMFINDTGGGTSPLGGVAPVGQYAASSWTDTDRANLSADFNLIIPHLCKVGYVLDGIIHNTYPWASFNPQIQLLQYTSALLQISRDSDGAVGDINPVPTADSQLDTSAISAFCAGTTGRIARYYDQTNNNAFVKGGTTAPIIYQSGALITLGGKPAMLFNGSTDFIKQTVIYVPSFSANIYFNCGVQVSDHSANYAILGFDVANGIELRIQATTGYIELLTNAGTSIFVGSAMGAFPLNVPMVIELSIDGSNVYGVWANGTKIGAGTIAATYTLAGKIQIGVSGATPSDFFKGRIGGGTISNVPEARPQFVAAQYMIDFWSATTAITITTAVDNFTGANATLLASHTMDVGSGWTDHAGNHAIQSNAAQPNTLVSGATISTFDAVVSDGHYTCTLTPVSGGFGSADNFMPALVARFVDANNYWFIRIEPQNNIARLYRVTGGAISPPLINTIAAFPSGTAAVIQIVTVGSSIGFSVNGSQFASVSDATFSTATRYGLRSEKTGSPSSNCIYDTLSFVSP